MYIAEGENTSLAKDDSISCGTWGCNSKTWDVWHYSTGYNTLFSYKAPSSDKFHDAINFQKWLVNSDSPTRQKLLSSFKSHCYFLQKAFPRVSFLASKILKNSLATSITHSITVLPSFRKETYIYIRFNDRKKSDLRIKSGSLTWFVNFISAATWLVSFIIAESWLVSFISTDSWLVNFSTTETWLVSFITAELWLVNIITLLKSDWSVFSTNERAHKQTSNFCFLYSSFQDWEKTLSRPLAQKPRFSRKPTSEHFGQKCSLDKRKSMVRNP